MKTIVYFLFLFPSVLCGQILRPGDANNDGRVDHIDVLAIGLSYGFEGPPREPVFQGIDWAPKAFTPWPNTLPSTMINFAYSDCDGDGVVLEADMEALELNYDSTQTDSEPPPLPYAPPDTASTSALPRLVFTFDKDTATVRDTLRLDIFYEHPNGLPEEEAPLGVAFTIEFNEMLVKDSLTQVFFEPSATDLLFVAAAEKFADARAVAPGRIEFGTAGKGKPGLFPSRPLGTALIIIEDVIVRTDTFWTKFKIDISNPIMINAKEQIMLFDIVVDEVVLYQELSDIPPEPIPLQVRLYPSPVFDRLQIESPGAPLTQLQVSDALGKRIVWRQIERQPRLELNTSSWTPGWYWISMMAADGRMATQKILKK